MINVKEYYEQNEIYCYGCLVRMTETHWFLCDCEKSLTRDQYITTIDRMRQGYYSIPRWKRTIQKLIWRFQPGPGRIVYRYEEWLKETK